MTDTGKADKSHDWIDTWKSMEALYKKYPEKLKAIGQSINPSARDHMDAELNLS